MLKSNKPACIFNFLSIKASSEPHISRDRISSPCPSVVPTYQPRRHPIPCPPILRPTGRLILCVCKTYVFREMSITEENISESFITYRVCTPMVGGISNTTLFLHQVALATGRHYGVNVIDDAHHEEGEF